MFSCPKINHNNSMIEMVCIDKQCKNNEIVCIYCFCENHSGHHALPISNFISQFKTNFCLELFDIENLSEKISQYHQYKSIFLNKINEMQNFLFNILENCKQKIMDLFESNNESNYLSISKHIINLQSIFNSVLPSKLSDFKELVNSALKLIKRNDEKQIEDPKNLKFYSIKESKNALSLYNSRLTHLDTRLSKISENLQKILDTDIKSFYSQFSFDHLPLIKEISIPDRSILEGHRNYIRRIVSLSGLTNNCLIASCSQDGQIRVWNYLLKSCIAVLSGHKGQIYDLIYLEKKKVLVSASQDHNIKIWSLGSWKCIKTLVGHEGWVGYLSFNLKNNLLFSGGSDRRVRIWNIEKGNCLYILNPTESEIFSLENGEWEGSLKIIVGDIRGKIYIFTIENEKDKKINTYNAHNDKILKLKLYKSKEKQKKILISCSNDRTIKIWNVKNMEIIKVLEIHSHFVTDFYFDESSECILSCSFDNTIKLVSLKNYETLATWKENHHLINIIWLKIANILCTSSTASNEFGINLIYF